MTGCEIISFNARFFDNKGIINGLVDSPLDRLRTHVVAEARKKNLTLMNWFEANQIAQSVVLYPLNYKNNGKNI